MQIYFGVVEDRNDPLMIGRVRVRVRGIHTHEKTLISTMDLPWSTVIMPVTTAGLGGFGETPSLVEGTSVAGVFTDEEKQQFLVLGVNQGISQDGFIENEKGELYANTVDAGFNDPRRNSESDYKDTAEDTTPAHAPNRAYGMKFGLDFYPHLTESVVYNYYAPQKTAVLDPKDETKVNDIGTPYYPLITNASDINVFSAQLDAKDSHAVLQRDLSAIESFNKKFPDDSHIKPRYPFNKATYTESGHLFELDDTRGAERVSLQHRTGTYFEWKQDGDSINRIAKDNYTVICGDDDLWIQGNVNIRVMGNANIIADKGIDVNCYGGPMSVYSSEGLTLDGGGKPLTLKSSTAVIVESPTFSPNAMPKDD